MKFVTNLFTAIKDHLLKSTSSIDFFSKLAEVNNMHIII